MMPSSINDQSSVVISGHEIKIELSGYGIEPGRNYQIIAEFLAVGKPLICNQMRV